MLPLRNERSRPKLPRKENVREPNGKRKKLRLMAILKSKGLKDSMVYPLTKWYVLCRFSRVQSLKHSQGDTFAQFDSDEHEEDEEEDDEDDVEEELQANTINGADSDPEDAGEDSDVPLSELSEDDRADTIPHQRLTINNTAALLASTNRVRIARPGHKFSVHNSLVSSIPTNIPDPNDDLTRELEFYRICSSAAKEARRLLKKEHVPFTRPSDYFAEMVKSDEHMGKIKKKMYDEAARKKASGEARKQRDLKKFGKQVQVAKEQERAKERKQTMEKISSLKRKRKGMDTGKVNEDDDLFDIGVEDDADSGRKRDQNNSKFKRQKRDQKFGFGGKKRFSKSGDATSSADMRSFSTKRMKQGGAAKRPGKNRRAAAR